MCVLYMYMHVHLRACSFSTISLPSEHADLATVLLAHPHYDQITSRGLVRLQAKLSSLPHEAFILK